jgi:hypothetical protein
MLYKKAKYLLIIAIALFLRNETFAQNFVLPGGEYMDTTSAQNAKCKNSIQYFYGVGGKYPKSSSTLLKEVQAFLQQKNVSYGNSGYITFRFIVDCGGKPLPGTEVLQTDGQYAGTHFDKELVNELFSFFKTMDAWRIAASKSGEAFSYKAFLTFKIKNGKVINIIP